jgi:hypothetical protein
MLTFMNTDTITADYNAIATDIAAKLIFDCYYTGIWDEDANELLDSDQYDGWRCWFNIESHMTFRGNLEEPAEYATNGYITITDPTGRTHDFKITCGGEDFEQA